jgi:hypothetical protein
VARAGASSILVQMILADDMAVLDIDRVTRLRENLLSYRTV